ncbi:SET and MYND domain-containing protein 4 isoform X2 [Phymastichus coffea]|uniref:SET and MYND domain-containing protein 4 isoform X2 n=1 Tax=Phymastichus coffea TaxID=108790 RepID=UPI00273CE867|nr:SET and MYND domain-containing protein 4 isoform X2 [Phymastichus coffea]
MDDLDEFFVEDAPNYNEVDDEYEVGDFFRGNLLKVRGAVSEKDFRRFAALGNNGDRVGFVLQYEDAHALPTEVVSDERKSASECDKWRKEGNTAFGVGHYEKSIEEYNKGALAAPKEQLGVLLANRSAAFYHLERFDLALRDCEEALKVGYPRHLLYKLEERRARCLLGLNYHAKAMEAFKSAIRALDEANVPSDKRTKLESDMRMMLAVMDKGHEMNEARHGISKERMLRMENNNMKLRELDLLPTIKECNAAYPACSKAIEFRDAGGEVGRFAVATKDIQPGDLLVIEPAHCSTTLGEYRVTHCHRCAVRIVASFPASCMLCSSVGYCSPNCRNADEPVHRYECVLLGPLWCSHASVTTILAVRAVIQQSFEELFATRDELRETHGKLEISKAKPYLSRDYRSFYNLVTHEHERTAEDLFHRAYVAAWLLRLIKTTSYLPAAMRTPDAPEVPLSEGEHFLADIILHHLQLLQFNCHELSEFVRPRKGKPNLARGKNLFVGGGVYPTVALFNHSCNPGVVRYFAGNTMIVRAIRSIPAGAEVCENYGPIFTEEEEKERKRRLRLQYWFDCNCEACKDHWPLLEKIDPEILRFKCETGPSCGNVLPVNINTDMFMIPCVKCGKSTNLFKGLKAMQDTEALHKNAMNNLEAGNHEAALKSFLEILKILDETLALPVKDYHLCQQNIRLCMLAYGNSAFV